MMYFITEMIVPCFYTPLSLSLSRTMLKLSADLSVNFWETSPQKGRSRFWRYDSIPNTLSQTAWVMTREPIPQLWHLGFEQTTVSSASFFFFFEANLNFACFTLCTKALRSDRRGALFDIALRFSNTSRFHTNSWGGFVLWRNGESTICRTLLFYFRPF